MIRCLLTVLLFWTSYGLFAQDILPYTFINNSDYSDDEIYIGLVGKFGNNVDVWMDMSDYALIPMSAEDNTLDGPDWSTPSTWKYPDIFTKLSEIEDQKIEIPHGLSSCRIFISFESPMYLHFHETGGYAGANLSASTDPNNGIRWELVELTWGNAGLWTNTSRVDAYQYPIALEVVGFTDGPTGASYAESYLRAISGEGTPKYGKVGEKLPHQTILDSWDTTVSDDYLQAKVIKEHSIDGNYIIEQPSKVDGFPEDILAAYIDEIWDTYKNHDLAIDIGERGVWTGRVTDSIFNFTDPVDGSIATIYGKPSSFNAIEGSGFMAFTEVSANDNREKHDEDLMIQAQMAAAINRHAIYTDIIDGSVQYTHDADRYFVFEPYNEYVSFFHQEEVSYDSKTYAFAYDDVGDHSSTLQNTFPVEVRVIIGAYHDYVVPASEVTLLTISPYVQEIELGEELQFVAQAYDQYGKPINSNISWSLMGGSSISDDGLFSATSLGEHTITASDAGLTRSITLRVIEVPDFSGCVAESPNGDYNYVATDDPTLTFIPNQVGNGEPVCLLYYKTDSLSNYIDAGVEPNVAYSLDAMVGDTVSFYYTYSLTTGGENTTLSTPHSFVVGSCSIVSDIKSYDPFDELSVAPNPTGGQNVLISGIQDELLYEIFSYDGRKLDSGSISGKTEYSLSLSALTPGLYVVKLSSLDGISQKSFKLIHH